MSSIAATHAGRTRSALLLAVSSTSSHLRTLERGAAAHLASRRATASLSFAGSSASSVSHRARSRNTSWSVRITSKNARCRGPRAADAVPWEPELATTSAPSARRRLGCSTRGAPGAALPSATFFVWFALPRITSVQPTSALRASSGSARASGSDTQQWIPRRPEYTQTMWRKPKSSRSTLSSTSTATAISFQHRAQICLSEQHVRISS